MTASSDQIKTACGHKHTWHEEDDETGCLHEDFCNLLNEIQRLPEEEQEPKLQRVRAAIKSITGREYDPDIEARREDYEKLAAAIAHMTALHSSRFPDLLDIKGIHAEGDHDHFIDAVHGHLRVLWENIDWFSARTLRKFYVEMRLHVDQMEREREADKAA